MSETLQNTPSWNAPDQSAAKAFEDQSMGERNVAIMYKQANQIKDLTIERQNLMQQIEDIKTDFNNQIIDLRNEFIGGSKGSTIKTRFNSIRERLATSKFGRIAIGAGAAALILTGCFTAVDRQESNPEPIEVIGEDFDWDDVDPETRQLFADARQANIDRFNERRAAEQANQQAVSDAELARFEAMQANQQAAQERVAQLEAAGDTSSVEYQYYSEMAELGNHYFGPALEGETSQEKLEDLFSRLNDPMYLSAIELALYNDDYSVVSHEQFESQRQARELELRNNPDLHQNAIDRAIADLQDRFEGTQVWSGNLASLYVNDNTTTEAKDVFDMNRVRTDEVLDFGDFAILVKCTQLVQEIEQPARVQQVPPVPPVSTPDTTIDTQTPADPEVTPDDPDTEEEEPEEEPEDPEVTPDDPDTEEEEPEEEPEDPETPTEEPPTEEPPVDDCPDGLIRGEDGLCKPPTGEDEAMDESAASDVAEEDVEAEEGYEEDNAEDIANQQEEDLEAIESGDEHALEETEHGVEETDGDVSDVGGAGANDGGSQGGTVAQPGNGTEDEGANEAHQEDAMTEGNNEGTTNVEDPNGEDAATEASDEQPVTAPGSDPGGF